MLEDKLREKANYKFKLIKEFYKSDRSIRRFCKEKGLKKSTFNDWLKQFEIRCYDGLIEKRLNIIELE